MSLPNGDRHLFWGYRYIEWMVIERHCCVEASLGRDIRNFNVKKNMELYVFERQEVYGNEIVSCCYLFYFYFYFFYE